MVDERLNPNWGNELKAATNAAGEVVGVLKPQSDSARAPIVVATTDAVTGRVISLKSGSQDVSAPYTWAQALALGASGNAGLVIRVSDVGLGAGSHWISDGTYWRPINGSVVIASVAGSIATPISAFTGVTASAFTLPDRPIIPANMLIPGVSQITVIANTRRTGATATAVMNIRFGTAKNTGDAPIIATSIAATSLLDNYFMARASVSESGRTMNTNYVAPGGTGTNAYIDKTGNINTAADMGFTFDISSANVADSFALLDYEIRLAQ